MKHKIFLCGSPSSIEDNKIITFLFQSGQVEPHLLASRDTIFRCQDFEGRILSYDSPDFNGDSNSIFVNGRDQRMNYVIAKGFKTQRQFDQLKRLEHEYNNR